jgi:hypothetical protein
VGIVKDEPKETRGAGRAANGRFVWTLLLLALAAASVPRFFSIYRSAAFETFPRDPYETYVLELAGEPGGGVPGAPHAYRVLSAAAAVPVYHAVPVLYAFSRLEEAGVDARRLRATQAMALVSWLALLGLCAAVYRATRGLGAAPLTALAAALAAWILAEGTNLLAMDTVALCLVAGLSLSLRRPGLFVPLVLVSAGFNEKIPLMFSALLLARFIAHRLAGDARLPRPAFGLWPQALAALAAVALYAAARLAFPVGGGEHQTDPAAFAAGVLHTAARTFSAKGLILNLLPGLCVLALWATARKFQSAPGAGRAGQALFHPADLAALALLAALAFAARIEFGVGRVLLYTFPLYLPAAFAALQQRSSR